MKTRLRNCHRMEENKETRPLNAMQEPRRENRTPAEKLRKSGKKKNPLEFIQ